MAGAGLGSMNSARCSADGVAPSLVLIKSRACSQAAMNAASASASGGTSNAVMSLTT